jgi:cytochrome d ubiquinol oxidase subunit II
MPLVIGYQAWSFWTFRKRLRREDFESHADAPAIAEVRSAG